MNQESLRIILRTYSKGGFNEDEVVQLIEDLYNKNTYSPWFVPASTPFIQWPQITYEEKYPQYEITCSKHD